MDIPVKTNEELTANVTDLGTQINNIRIDINHINYLFKLHIKNYSEDISGLQKRMDALEHPNLQAPLKSFQDLRNATTPK